MAGDFEPKLHRDNHIDDSQKYSKPITMLYYIHHVILAAPVWATDADSAMSVSQRRTQQGIGSSRTMRQVILRDNDNNKNDNNNNTNNNNNNNNNDDDMFLLSGRYTTTGGGAAARRSFPTPHGSA